MPSSGSPVAQVPRWFWPVFALALAVNVLPLLVTRYLPFNDLCGATGLIGAWAHRHDAASRVTSYFDFNVHAGPNVFFYAVTMPLSAFLPATVATNLFVAIFCVAALPCALLFALRAFDKEPTLALLAFPITYHRCLWYGFAGSVAAVPILLLVLGLANQTFVAQRWGWRDGALAVALVLLAASHAFLFLFTAALVVVWAILAVGQPGAWWRRGAVVIPSLVYLGPFLGALLTRGAPGGSGGMLHEIWARRRPFSAYLADAHDWFLNGYASAVDEWLAGLFVLTLVALLIRGIRSAGARPSSPPVGVEAGADPAAGRLARWRSRLWRARVPLAFVAAVAGYFLLPMTLPLPTQDHRPRDWWAVNVRLLIPAVLLAVASTRTSRRGLPRWSVLPVVAAGMLYAGYLTYDFHTWWARTELDGFRQALDAVPEGQRLLPLYPPFEDERHYSHFPMGYLADYYVAERGGTTAPILAEMPEEFWIIWKPIGPGPAWGMARSFVWSRHARDWDYFLVKQPAPGNGPPTRVFADAPPAAVTKIFERGLWSVWRHNR